MFVNPAAGPVTTGTRMPNGASSSPATQTPTVENRDVCDISPDWERQVDWNHMLEDYLAQMAQACPQVDVTIADVADEDLAEFAASLGEGAHLVVSTGFLRRMVSGAEAFYKGKELLSGLMRQLSGSAQDGAGAGAFVGESGVTFWNAAHRNEEDERPWESMDTGYETLIETMKRLQKEAEANKEKFKIRLGSSAFNSPAEALGRLARANTVGGVKMAMSQADRSICSLKLALALGPDKDKAKIRAAIAALEKVIIRGGQKIRSLNEEEDLRARQKKAEQQARERKAEQLRYERELKRTKRKIVEHGQIIEGYPWYYYQQEIMRKKQIPSQWEQVSGMDGALAADVGIGAESISAGGGESFSGADVTLSPTVELSI